VEFGEPYHYRWRLNLRALPAGKGLRAEIKIMSKNPETYSIVLRVRRVTVEDAYVAVPVTNSLLIPNEDGTSRINFEAFVAEAIRISGDRRAEWQVESATTEPHPTQGPLPDGRRCFDAHYADDGNDISGRRS
jgi:hypothetical protein